MKLLLDTSTATCRLTIVDNDLIYHDYVWQADRALARDLLAYLRDRLAEHQAAFRQIDGLAVMKGPGSFTGLRIGATVINTLADSLEIAVVGEIGQDWREKALARLQSGENDRIVMPEYGSEANITKPRK